MIKFFTKFGDVMKKQNYFEELEARLNKSCNCKVVIPLADNEAVAIAIKEALNKKLISGATLVGSKDRIKSIYGSLADSDKISIVEAISEEEALLKSVNEIKAKRADIIMKGMCQSASLIKAVLDKKNGLEHNFLSHITAFQLPDKDYACFLTDSAVNVSPDEETIINEINNVTEFLLKSNSQNKPTEELLQFINGKNKVALLSANEKVSDKMPSTKLAEAVVNKLSSKTTMIVEGPVAFDLAVSPKSAQIKKYKGKLQGDATIFVAPHIETANALYKSLQHYIKADMGGILFGASCPVVHPSRADNARTKFNSLLLALSYVNY